jgi:hypothetical protein
MFSFKAAVKVAVRAAAPAGALIVAAGLAASVAVAPLAALTMRECGAAYKSAQKSGTLGGLSWQEFRKSRCGPGAAPGLAPGGRAVFPTAIAPKYSDETPGKGRRLTCLDQYRLNKASDANGGLRWIERGGGYYSECNKRLRAAPKGR